MIRIFFLGASPDGLERLRTDKEVRVIREALERSHHRDRIEVHDRHAVTIADLRRGLLDLTPEIVHFAGHATRDGLIVEGPAEAGFVPTQALGDLFGAFRHAVKCVVLNACYAEAQAQAIVPHVDCVVGMQGPVSDRAALLFTEAFYDAIGRGCTIREAFDLGFNNLPLHDLGPGHGRPVLLEREPGASSKGIGQLSPELAFPVSAREDVVLALHPQAIDQWRDIVPGARDAGLAPYKVPTPTDAWWRDEPWDPARWKAMMDRTLSALEQALTEPGRRLHLILKGPYALGAMLGARLELHGKKLIVYQETPAQGIPDQKRWESWGPTWQLQPTGDPTPFFKPIPELELEPSADAGAVVFILDVSGRGRAGLERHLPGLGLGSPLATVHLQAVRSGRDALSTASIDQACSELNRCLQRISEVYPGATVHAFFYAPLALVVRGFQGLAVNALPFVVYERNLADGERFIPILRLHGRKVELVSGL